MSDLKRPPFIVSSTDVAEEPGKYPESDETLGYWRAVGQATGLLRIGLHVVRLAPGQRTSWPHAEEKVEEFVFVLEGDVDAWVDGVIYPLQKGDLASFPAGTGICHSLINNTNREVHLLVGGERTKPDNRVYYPLHPTRRKHMGAEIWWDDHSTNIVRL